MKSQSLCGAPEDQQRWNKELDEFPDYKAKIEKRRDERIRKQQEHAAKSSIFHAAKKRPTRPGKMALPKRKRAAKTRRTAKKIVQASKTSEPKPRASRKTRSQKVSSLPRRIAGNLTTICPYLIYFACGHIYEDILPLAEIFTAKAEKRTGPQKARVLLAISVKH